MSTATVAACRVCTGPLPDPPASGRHPTYCSEACRRSAEFAIRRLNRRLEDLESRCSQARIDAELAQDASDRERVQEHLRIFTTEANLLEDRLRALIGPR